VAWHFRRAPKGWQTDHPDTQKGIQELMHQLLGISLHSLPGKVYVKCLVEKCREIIEAMLDDTQCGFRRGHSITEQNSTHQQIFEKTWEYAKDIYTCFVDFRKVHDRVPLEKRLGVLWEYGVDGRLLRQVTVFLLTIDVLVGGVNSQPFTLILDSDKGVRCHHSSSYSISGLLKLFVLQPRLKKCFSM